MIDKELTKKLEEFSSLPEGWDFGEGIPTIPRVKKEAYRIIEMSSDFGLSIEAHPCTDGGLDLVFYFDGLDHFPEITINHDLMRTARYEIGIGSSYTIENAIVNATDEDIISLFNKAKYQFSLK